jgi:Trehalose utilisation
MIPRRALLFGLTVFLLAAIVRPVWAAEPVKVVIVAGSNFSKVGEHDYLAGSAVLTNLLRQTPGIVPVLAVDWPKKPEETFEGARAVVMFCDGGDKHPFLKEDRLVQIEKLAAAGVGLVALHQVDDVPKNLGDRTRVLLGAAWENGFSQRAHWETRFSTFPGHPVFRGVAPFTIDDGWLYHLRFVPELRGVSPLLRTAPPKAPAALESDSDSIVSWAYDRPGGGRSFIFTGAHLHESLAEEGYRRFLVNGILWAARVEIPEAGAPVALAPGDLKPTPEPQGSRKSP